MIVSFKKLHPDAKTPSYAHLGDAGMDVWAISKEKTKDYIEYGTGLTFELPKNYVMLIFARGSVSNTGLILANCVGVLDSGYRGELMLRFKKIGEKEYQAGDKIGQILIVKYPSIKLREVNKLTATSREGGKFGSTGKK